MEKSKKAGWKLFGEYFKLIGKGILTIFKFFTGRYNK